MKRKHPRISYMEEADLSSIDLNKDQVESPESAQPTKQPFKRYSDNVGTEEWVHRTKQGFKRSSIELKKAEVESPGAAKPTKQPIKRNSENVRTEESVHRAKQPAKRNSENVRTEESIHRTKQPGKRNSDNIRTGEPQQLASQQVEASTEYSPVPAIRIVDTKGKSFGMHYFDTTVPCKTEKISIQSGGSYNASSLRHGKMGKISLQSGANYNNVPTRLSYSPTVFKAARTVKALDGKLITCFFTKAYCFSNHFHRDNLLEIDGRKYICVEQFYMYYKARVFNDVQAAERIQNATVPSSMKKLGSSIANFDQTKWRNVGIQVMVIGSLRKYERNEDLREQLFNTNGSLLVEASPFDTFWGVGLSIQAAENKDPSNWPGKNVLGRILTMVRERLMERPEFKR